MIDTSAWKSFRIGDLFSRLTRGRCHASSDLDDGDDVWYVGAKKSENGLMRKVAHCAELEFEGNCIVFICNGEGSVGYALYQDKTFIPSGDLIVGYSERLNPRTGLFLVTVLDLERAKYSFGRKWGKYVEDTIIRLPATSAGEPDWSFMEAYVGQLSGGPLTTSVRPSHLPLKPHGWKRFLLHELFDIDMGSKLDLIAMTFDSPSVNFVGRSSANNGVAAKVDLIEGQHVYPAGSISVALGGSIGTACLQHKPFYTSQNVSVLHEKSPIPTLSKLFVCTVIMHECATKYVAFGRELNVHIRRDFDLRLPSTKEGNPDWQWMEDYMKSLPYSDRIPE